METAWPLTRALEIGDRAVGVPVLTELYGEMKATPVKLDLPKLWSKLGVKIKGKTISLNDAAPWASTRRAIAVDTSNSYSPLTDSHAGE
jgi:hypothetical protein